MSALWKHSCSSVVGTKHLSQGTLCEDASCAFWDDDTQTLFLAVADGAGSVEEAATGAQEVIKAFQERAVDLVLELSQQDLDNKVVLRNLLIELANYLRVRLEILANSSGLRLDQLATTFLCVICTRTNFLALQIGDGFIMTARPSGKMQVCFMPVKGQYANETCFLTSQASVQELVSSQQLQLKVEPLEGVTGIALITDGLEYVTMDMRGFVRPRAAFYLKLMNRLSSTDEALFKQQMESYLFHNKQLNEQTDDDKTIVLAVNQLHPPIFDNQKDKFVAARRQEPEQAHKEAGEAEVKARKPRVINLTPSYTPPKPRLPVVVVEKEESLEDSLSEDSVKEPEFQLLLPDEDIKK